MKIFEIYIRIKERIAHVAFDLRIAKQIGVWYMNNKPIDVYIVWGRW